MTQMTLDVTLLGHRGDGIAQSEGGPVFVAGALPGETVSARISNGRATDVTIISASPDRIEPVCRHFDACGGCSVQHYAEAPYLAWKQDMVVKALADRGIEEPVGETIAGRPESRRRAVLTATRAGRAILLGYHEKASHKLVDIKECPVLDPAIVKSLPGLKALCSELMPKKGDLRLTVLATRNGLDAAFEQASKAYDSRFAALSSLAMTHGLARLTVNGETLIEIRPPALDMNGLTVVPPPAGFTQATEEAEEALSSLVLQNLGKARKVADLFAGVGTFALRIARKASVHAVEGDAAAIAALDRALRVPQGLKQVTHERRDLFRRPLMAAELNAYDAVVFDPPRAGAQAQAEQIAASKVPAVVAVSCNPATLARDLRILLDGGYKIKSVTPVDQFLWSSHIECVVALEKT